MIYQVQLQCPSTLMVEAEDAQDAANKFWDALSKAGALVLQPLAGSGDAGPKLMELLKSGLAPKAPSNIIVPELIPPRQRNGHGKAH